MPLGSGYFCHEAQNSNSSAALRWEFRIPEVRRFWKKCYNFYIQRLSRFRCSSGRTYKIRSSKWYCTFCEHLFHFELVIEKRGRFCTNVRHVRRQVVRSIAILCPPHRSVAARESGDGGGSTNSTGLKTQTNSEQRYAHSRPCSLFN